MGLNINWLLPKKFWPPRDGAAVASSNLVRALIDQGHRVRIFYFGEADETPAPISKSIWHPAESFGLPKALLVSPLARAVHTFESFYKIRGFSMSLAPFFSAAKGEAFHALQRELLSQQADVTVIDGLHASALLWDESTRYFLRSPRLGRLVYRAHNCEAQIFERRARQSTHFVLSKVFENEAKSLGRFEADICRFTEHIFCVSPDDSHEFIDKYSIEACKVSVLPIGMRFAEYMDKFKTSEDLKILFFGKLNWPPNVEGLEWFLDHVWKPLVATGTTFKLVVAGASCAPALRAKLETVPQLEFLGEVESVDALYQSSDLVIAPIFFGGGTRVKIIESIAYSCPVMSTLVGAEGLGLQPNHDYILVNRDPSSWLQALRSLSVPRLSVIARSSYDKLRQSHSSNSMVQVFLSKC